MSRPHSVQRLRRRPRLPCAVVVWAVVACAAVLGGCGGKAHSARPLAHLGSGRGAPTLGQVSAILDRHGRAVMARSDQAFLADVDTAPAAAAFRQRQSAEIAALTDVPLDSWAYEVSSPVTDASATAAAAKRLGAPALIVHVSLSYALERIDAVPTSHDLWWTFVTRHGRVFLAGDDDMAEVGGTSWRGPWDFGPIVVERGASSLVLGHPQDAGKLRPLAADVDAAVPVVTRVWGTGWTQQVAVVVPASQDELAALGGQGSTISDISAATVFEAPNSVTGAVAGARVIMNPAELDRLTAVGRRIVIQHEITHLASAPSTGPASPRWLVEGFADYVANLDSGQPVIVAAGELRQLVRRSGPPAGLPSDADFAAGAAALPLAYEESWLACRLIAARAEQAGLVRLYRLVGASADTSAHAVRAAMQSVLHESTTAFTAQWRAYLAGLLR